MSNWFLNEANFAFSPLGKASEEQIKTEFVKMVSAYIFVALEGTKYFLDLACISEISDRTHLKIFTLKQTLQGLPRGSHKSYIRRFIKRSQTNSLFIVLSKYTTKNVYNNIIKAM